MSNAARLLDLLIDASRIIAADEEAFEDSVEELANRVHHLPTADIIGSMLYAASEAIRNKPNDPNCPRRKG